MIPTNIESLGYDWERTADPAIAPKYPYKVYLPRSIEDVVAAVRECRELGQRLRVRGGGHSSNDLVLEEGGCVLWTLLFDKILRVDAANKCVVVQSGACLARIDEHLRPMGFSLPVMADSCEITAGGLASVGGVGPTSPRAGLFLDNVRAVEVVDWQGRARVYSRETDPHELNRMLGATGRHGVIATLTLDVVAVDKWATLTENRRLVTYDFDRFIEAAREAIERSDEALMGRGAWVEFPAMGRLRCVGQYSHYVATRPTALKRWRERLAFGVLHGLGAWGRRKRPLAGLANFLGSAAFLFPPRYSTIKNAETFTEKVFDVAAAGPVRWLAVFMPMRAFDDLLRELRGLATRYRDAHGGVDMIGLYVVGLNSPWLAGGSGERFCDVLMHLSARPEKMSPAVLDALVAELDALCIAHGAVRYQHTKTSADPKVHARVNRNHGYPPVRVVRTGTGA